MKKQRLLLCLGSSLLGLLVASLTAFAHHSFQAEYDDQKPITLKGQVTKVTPDNPHGWIYMDVANDKGRIVHWAVELPPPNVLYRNGFNTDVYRAMMVNHEEVTVAAFLAKDGSKHAWAAGLTRGDGKTVITLGGLPAQPYNVKPTTDRKVNH